MRPPDDSECFGAFSGTLSAILLLASASQGLWPYLYVSDTFEHFKLIVRFLTVLGTFVS